MSKYKYTTSVSASTYNTKRRYYSSPTGASIVLVTTSINETTSATSFLQNIYSYVFAKINCNCLLFIPLRFVCTTDPVMYINR